MLTMTGFSMSSFGLFTFPYMLQEDRIEHWLTYIEHSKVSIAAYYLSKIFRVLLNFMVAIIVTFCVGAFFRDVEMPFFRWVGSGALLLLSGLLFLAFGLLIAQIKSQQFMSLVANIIYLVLPIVSGSWVPISMFLSGFRASLSGHLSIMSMNWSLKFCLSMGNFHGNHFCLFWLIL